MNPVFSPWIVFALSGELDMSRTDELEAMFAPFLGGEPVNALVDLSDVGFMDSSAIRWLLRVQDQIDRVNGKLHLVAPSDGPLMRLLSLSGLAERFAVFPTRIAAEQGPSQPDEIDHLLAKVAGPGTTPSALQTLVDGDARQGVTDAGYNEWTGLGHRLTEKGRDRTNRVNQG